MKNMVKCLGLFVLLASLSGVAFLSPVDPDSRPADRSRPSAGSQAPLGAGAKRVDFNGDGYEDILWRYCGTGGYDRVWFLGSAEGAQALGAVDAGMTSVTGKSQAKARASKRNLTGPRDMGLAPKRKGRAPVRHTEALMGGIDRRNMGSAMVQDPRQAGGGSYEFSRTLVTDPRQVAAAGEPLGAAPPLLGGADVLPVGDLDWQIVGAADFDNDTQTDILWRNAATGSNVLWFMNGADWSSSVEIVPVPDQSWQIVGTGDFNNDTHVDILWRNIADGTNVVWYMNGAEWSASAVLLGVGDLDWQIVGTGDFNNDTHVDILWRYYGAGGSNVVWYMDNANWIGSAELIPVADPSWQIVATGDYNDDGSVDLFWRYNGDGGLNVIWYLNNVTWTGSAELPSVSDLTWKVAGRGAFADRYQPFERTLDPAGGSYFFPNGITLEVPAGAVSVPTTVATRLVPSSSIDAFINRYGLVTKHCLAAFDGTPHGLTFSQPVRVKMRTKPLPNLNSIPLHYKADLEHEIADYAGADLDFNTRTNMVEFTLTDFSLHVVPAEELQLVLDDCLMPGSCRCGWITAGETSVDRIVEGECHAIQVSGFVIFHDCPLSPQESWSMSDLEYGWIEAPAPDPVKVGEDVTIGAAVHNASGQVVPNAWVTYTWASEADKDIIGIVNLPASNQARITGLKCGTAKVKAEAGCGNAMEIIVDVWSEVVSVAVSPATAKIGVNTALGLEALLIDESGQPAALRDPVEWTSSNPAVVSVAGATGREALAQSYENEGTVTITAKAGCDPVREGYAFITVERGPVASVEVSPGVAAVPVGDLVPLVATPKDSEGNPLSGRTVTWWSSAPGIVEVSDTGMLWGVSGGWAWIAATCEGVTGWALAGVPEYDMFVLTKEITFSTEEENYGLGVNNVGHIVGFDGIANEMVIYYQDGVIDSWPLEYNPEEDSTTDIDDSGQVFQNMNRGTNAAGHVVGTLDEEFPDDVGFYQAGEYYVIINLHARFTDDGQTIFNDINDFDQIVGWYDSGEPEIAFILTPCPFPWALGPGVYPPFLPQRPLAPGMVPGTGTRVGGAHGRTAPESSATGKVKVKKEQLLKTDKVGILPEGKDASIKRGRTQRGVPVSVKYPI